MRHLFAICIISALCACGGSSNSDTHSETQDVVQNDAIRPDSVVPDAPPTDTSADTPTADTAVDGIHQDVPTDSTPDSQTLDTPPSDTPTSDTLPSYDISQEIPIFSDFQAITSFPDLLIGTWQSGYGDPWITFVTPQVGIDEYGLGYLLVPDRRDPEHPATRTFCFDYGISSSDNEGYKLIRDFKMVTIPDITCQNNINDGFSYTGYYDNDRYIDYVCTDGQVLSFHCLRSDPVTRSNPDLSGLWEMEEGSTDGYGTLYPNEQDYITQVEIDAGGTYTSYDYDCTPISGGEERDGISCPSSSFEGTWAFANGSLTLNCSSENTPCMGLSDPECSCTHSRLRGTYMTLLLEQKGRRFIANEATVEGFWYRVP